MFDPAALSREAKASLAASVVTRRVVSERVATARAASRHHEAEVTFAAAIAAAKGTRAETAARKNCRVTNCRVLTVANPAISLETASKHAQPCSMGGQMVTVPDSISISKATMKLEYAVLSPSISPTSRTHVGNEVLGLSTPMDSRVSWAALGRGCPLGTCPLVARK